MLKLKKTLPLVILYSLYMLIFIVVYGRNIFCATSAPTVLDCSLIAYPCAISH